MGETYKIGPLGFIACDGSVRSYIRLSGSEIHDDWLRKQEASMPEYLHELARTSSTTNTLYKLFDAYIVAALHGRRNAKVLDVGCGLSRSSPPYVATLRREAGRTGNVYVGLDPIAYDIDRRTYPFACARLEDLADAIDDRFDAFLFATSLDHFENLADVAHAVRTLAAGDAVCVFWVGLHDAALVGQQSGARAYRRLFSSLRLRAFVFHYFRNLIGMPVNYARLLHRRRNMRHGRPLDRLHFHYFTEASLDQSLAQFGTRIDTINIPGTASIFTTVRMATGARCAHMLPRPS
ncbi:MAG: hypothetical protein IT531_07800 [Burkholderiales bacterium]|nr:hypothetical protein [Burkholderiales bacterium]